MITPFKTNPCSYVSKAMTLPVLGLVFCAFTTRVHQHPQMAVLHPAAYDTIPSNISKRKLLDADSVYTNKAVINLNAGDSLVITFESGQDAVFNNAQNRSFSNDKILSKVEVESSYPGGFGAWDKYMSRKFSYPMDAQIRGIQGIVVVQFIVDKEGNVSDVEAVSGPTGGGLKEEAIRVIKKSGRWIPAIQDGLPVKSYKKQPIIFML